MAIRHFVILLLFLPVLASAQIKSDFVGICTFDGFTSTGGSNYRGDIENFIDRYSLGVTTKNIQVGDQVLDGSGDIFEVVTIHSILSNFEADVTVTALVSGSGAPSGSGQVYRVTESGIIPVGSVDDFGLSNITKGLIDMSNALKLDSLITQAVGGDSIRSLSFALDTLSIEMESDTVFKTVIPVDSLHQLQSDSISSSVRILTYDAGNNAIVSASGEGVTFAKNAASGEYTFSIPDSIVVFSATVDAETSDTDVGGKLYVAFNYSGTRVFNQSLATAWRPQVWGWESGGGAPSRGSPKTILPVKVQGISAAGSNNLEIVLENVDTITPNPVLQFNF